MKKVVFIITVFLVFGFSFLPEYDYENLNFGLPVKPWNYVGFYVENTIEMHAKKDIRINTEGDLILQTDQNNPDSQIIVYIPTSPNGEETVRGTLWFCQLTNTVKFEPINRAMCWGSYGY